MKVNVRKQNTGITLIALVITIIVLLILAGVSLAMLTGENGILTQANRAKKETVIASEKEKIELSLLESNMYDGTTIEGLENALNKYIGDEEYRLTGRETYVVTINKTKNSYRIANDIVEIVENYEEGTMYVTLYKDGTLTFSSANSTIKEKEVEKEFGNLQGKSYSSINKAPWLETDEYTNMIEKVIFLDEIKPISTQSWFQNCINLQTIENIGNLNVENTTNFQMMFTGCSKLKEVDLSNMDAGIATDMRWMFAGCTNLISLNLNNFNASNVTKMTQIFSKCENLVDLNIKGFNTSSVTEMEGMFYCCSSLKTIDLGELNISNVTNMKGMFNGCSGLMSLDFKGFNTSKVTNMRAMFSGCFGLTTLDLSYLDTSNVEDMQDMFYFCSNLTSINLNGFDTSKVKNMYRMFEGCTKLISLDLSSFNTSQVTNMNEMFYRDEKLKTIYVSDLWSIDNVTEGDNLFVRCDSLVGAIPFNSEKLDVSYANYTDGYFTFKEITNN